MTQRFDYLDIAKGIGILLVVWAHILITGASHAIIYAFHMPLFFFISGMLFDRDKYFSFGDFFHKRAKRLLIPYFIYSVATWGFWALFRYVRGDEVESYWMPLLQTFIAQGSGAFIVHNSALWFIPCLFAVEIIYFFFSKANEWITLFLCVFAAGIGCAMMQLYGVNYLFMLPWNLDAALFALPFYGVANVLKRHLSHEEIMQYVESHRLMVGLGVLILFAGMSFLALNYGECSMGSSSYMCPMWCFFLRAFMGCFGLVLGAAFICSLFHQGKLYDGLCWCGKNSLDIMCLHIPIKGVAIIGVAMLLNPAMDVSSSWKYSLVAFVITMIVMTPTIVVINRFIRK